MPITTAQNATVRSVRSSLIERHGVTASLQRLFVRAQVTLFALQATLLHWQSIYKDTLFPDLGNR